nr:hypothetical protein [Tanacetum cinerariifolium]
MGSEKITLPNESVPANEPDQIRKITRPAGVKLEHKKIWMLLTNFQVPGPSSIIFALQKITLKEYDKELDDKRKALVSLKNEERKPVGVKLEHEKIWMLLTNFQVPGPSSIIFAL